MGFTCCDKYLIKKHLTFPPVGSPFEISNHINHSIHSSSSSSSSLFHVHTQIHSHSDCFLSRSILSAIIVKTSKFSHSDIECVCEIEFIFSCFGLKCHHIIVRLFVRRSNDIRRLTPFGQENYTIISMRRTTFVHFKLNISIRDIENRVRLTRF